MLVEANPFDKFWSSGLNMNDKDICNSDKYKGKNMMGKILARIREEF